eukprot:Partr_v1_DN28577_c1_g1_i2_m73063 putative Uroporphyrinogen III synthase
MNCALFLRKAEPDAAGDNYHAEFSRAGFECTSIPVLGVSLYPDIVLPNQIRIMSLDQLSCIIAAYYAAVIVTSKNSAAALASLDRESPPTGHPEIKCFAVGKQTAERLQSLGAGWAVCCDPETKNAASLAEFIISSHDASCSKPYLFLCGQKRRDTIKQTLVNARLSVDEVIVYSTTPLDFSEQFSIWSSHVEKYERKIACFFSPSGVDAALDELLPLLSDSWILACIGSTTYDHLMQQKGVERSLHVVCADKPTPSYLLRAIMEKM